MTERHIEYLPLDEILSAEANPKDHDQAGIAASLRRFGTIEIITRDDRTGRLISGHGRTEQYRVARDGKEDPPDGVTVAEDGTWLIPVVCGWASADDDEARAALVAVNRLGERGGWKYDELGAILDDLQSKDRLGPAVGYDDDELATIIRALDAERLWDDFGEEQPDLSLGGGFDDHEYKIRTKQPVELLERLGYSGKEIGRRLVYWPADLPNPDEDPAETETAEDA